MQDHKSALVEKKHLQYRFLHLRSELVVSTSQKMVRLLGAALGPVACVRFIHECMTELHGDLIQVDRSMHGKGQANWLQQSLGVLVLVNEVSLAPLTSVKEILVSVSLSFFASISLIDY